MGCDHQDFSDLCFMKGDRILVMYQINDELVFGRNEDGEEGSFPVCSVKLEEQAEVETREQQQQQQEQQQDKRKSKTIDHQELESLSLHGTIDSNIDPTNRRT